MKKYLLAQLPAGYLKFISWFIVGIIILVSLKNHPLSTPIHGDEANYTQELDYLSHYGFYKTLTQGCSVGYSLVLLILSKIIPVSGLVLLRLVSAAGCLAGCFVILKTFDRFENIKTETKYLGMVFYTFCCYGFMWTGIPDTTHALIIFIASLILLNKINYRSVALVALLVFFAFTVKPVATFYIPAFLLFLLMNKGIKMMQRAAQIILFIGIFSVCFAVYHIPGYQAYGKLMLEDKGHTYEGSKRIESTTTWNEINNYYEAYNPNKRENKWHVSIDEVNEFKKNNPGKLDLSYTQFLQQHFGIWAKNAATKIFLELPYNVDCGMFYHKWTFINRWLKNLFIIKIISLIIFIAFSYNELDFIKKNHFLLVPLVYFVLLSLYVIPQLEGNWLISCLPYFALPMLQFLQKKIGVSIMLLGQLLMVFF